MASEDQGNELTPLQNAIFLLKQTQAKLAAYEHARSEPIAIVGMGCRFPGDAENPDAYWRMLREGKHAIREVPPERWDVDDYYDPDPGTPAKMSTRWGGFLKQKADLFDADFFGISRREAVRVDPQHRLTLEVAWEALEDAGIAPGEIAHTRTGVYLGTIGSDYTLLQSRDISDLDVFSGTGSSDAVLANRVSYVLDLNGPSIALDTACSSSLVTVDMACVSLRRRETDMALAGGVNFILSPEMTVALTKAHMMSPDGRCKAFDAAADGYVRGEGCGMLVLKRLSDAEAAGDRIHALIRGSAVNHDGRSNGLSAPNGPAQEAVIRAALADAHLTPHQIGMIEAHGTGTRLGDPIEFEALVASLCAGRPKENPLYLASVKTNIGHLESAAGIAGLIKAVLTLRHGEIPPHLHLTTVNPLLKIEESPIVIPTELTSWRRGDEPRRAGISSFGFGGTNAHIIVEEAPPRRCRRTTSIGRGTCSPFPADPPLPCRNLPRSTRITWKPTPKLRWPTRPSPSTRDGRTSCTARPWSPKRRNKWLTSCANLRPIRMRGAFSAAPSITITIPASHSCLPARAPNTRAWAARSTIRSRHSRRRWTSAPNASIRCWTARCSNCWIRTRGPCWTRRATPNR